MIDIQKEIELYKKYRDSKLNHFGLQLSDFKTMEEYLGCLTWLNAKSQAVPEGFVLVPYDVAERCMGHISIAMCHPNNTNAENDVMQMDLDILESRVEAQEQSQ